MLITKAQDIGKIVKKARKIRNITQAELAVFCNVGTRFIVELEQGKETAMLGKVLQVLAKLQVEINMQDSLAPKPDPQEILKSAMWSAYTVPWNTNK